MLIAVDVCLGARGAAILRDAGHSVIEARHGESDREWTGRALGAGVELFVSGDSDVEIIAYDADVRFIRTREGERGVALAIRVLESVGTAEPGDDEAVRCAEGRGGRT